MLRFDFYESGIGETIIITFPNGGLGIVDAHPSPSQSRPDILALTSGHLIHVALLGGDALRDVWDEAAREKHKRGIPGARSASSSASGNPVVSLAIHEDGAVQVLQGNLS